MPATSGPQYRLMQAAAHGNSYGKSIPVSVAKEFVAKTPKAKRRKFAKNVIDSKGSKK